MLAGFAKLEVSQQERSRESKAQPHTAPACALSWGWSGRLCSVHFGRWALQGSATDAACPAVGSAAPAPRKHTEGKGSPAEPSTACGASLLLEGSSSDCWECLAWPALQTARLAGLALLPPSAASLLLCHSFCDHGWAQIFLFLMFVT